MFDPRDLPTLPAYLALVIKETGVTLTCTHPRHAVAGPTVPIIHYGTRPPRFTATAADLTDFIRSMFVHVQTHERTDAAKPPTPPRKA